MLEFAKIFLVFRHGRKLRNPFYRWLPTMISIGFIIFTIPYAATGFAVPKYELLEYYVGMIFLDCLLWESLIAIGVLPVNSHYHEMFLQAETGMMILRKDGSIYSRSEGIETLSEEEFQQLMKSGMIIDVDGIEIHMSQIRGGSVVWQRDAKELRDRLDELKEKQEELQSEDELLRAELVNRSEQEKIAARKRLFNIINERTKEDNEKILKLLSEMRCGDINKELLSEAVAIAQNVKKCWNIPYGADRG